MDRVPFAKWSELIKDLGEAFMKGAISNEELYTINQAIKLLRRKVYPN